MNSDILCYCHQVLFIIGSTGVGKTKLSVELAKAFGGEIVNADAMQVIKTAAVCSAIAWYDAHLYPQQMYRGLNIATAKVTKEEMNGVKHHLLRYLPSYAMCGVYMVTHLSKMSVSWTAPATRPLM